MKLRICTLILPFAATLCASEPQPRPVDASKTTNAFFAMDTIARGGAEVVTPMLKELGYDGLGGTAGNEQMAKAIEAAGLRFFNGYLTTSFDSIRPALDDRHRGIIDRMAGSRSVLWLAIVQVQEGGRAVLKSSEDGDATAVAKLRELAEYAKPKGVRIALYPHTGFWLERVEDALRVADKLGNEDVGVTFNLCHWLKVEGSERDPLPVLQAAMPRLMFITINGADTGDTKAMGWDRLIQPLGSGSYDATAFLEKIRTVGYKGPVGFQGFGIRGEPREVLAKTIEFWRKMSGVSDAQ
jgi:sugar phosphate isomerase/epimerase